MKELLSTIVNMMARSKQSLYEESKGHKSPCSFVQIKLFNQKKHSNLESMKELGANQSSFYIIYGEEFVGLNKQLNSMILS